MKFNRRHFLGGLLALGGAAAGAVIANVYYPLAGLSDDLATRTGERRLHRLPDGSQLLLNARTRVNLSYAHGACIVHLLEGAISLTAHAAHPFLIRTNEGLVRPLGPRVMVRQQMRRTLVVAPDGEVEIETAAGIQTRIPPGFGVRFDSVLVARPRSDLLDDTAWESGWAIAHYRPLIEVIAAMRPYRKGMLRISTAAGGLLANGRYPLDDTDTALRALQTDMPIQVYRVTPWFTSIDVAVPYSDERVPGGMPGPA